MEVFGVAAAVRDRRGSFVTSGAKLLSVPPMFDRQSLGYRLPLSR
jgi:hypothetical protein